MNEYVRRKEVLLQLGYSSYRKYLRSQLWTDIRAKKLARDPECYGCGRKRSLQVHHTIYSMAVMSGESEEGLYSVCRGCHQNIEFTRAGWKRQPDQATAELKRLHRMRMKRRRVKLDTHTVRKSKDFRMFR